MQSLKNEDVTLIFVIQEHGRYIQTVFNNSWEQVKFILCLNVRCILYILSTIKTESLPRKHTVQDKRLAGGTCKGKKLE